jgi:hypothetical protein
MLSVTLKTHGDVFPHSGFNQQILQIPNIVYGSTINTMINNLNQYRGPDSQIAHLYNPIGQEIQQQFWNIQIKENMTFYVDRPNTGGGSALNN